MRLKRKYILLMSVLASILLPAIIYKLLDSGFIRLNYPSRKDYPIWGLDVSHHQGLINWAEVSKDNFQFVYIKATEGGDFRDPKFELNWKEARGAGLRVGAYHFFTFCRSVVDQIANVRSVVPVENDALPIAIDLEFGGNCAKVPPHDALIAAVESFISEIEKSYLKTPVVYVTEEFFEAFVEQHPMSHNIWFRNVFSKPSLPTGMTWTIWQFANRGRVRGIDTPVDLNVFNGDAEKFAKIQL